jgi:hypothetical protein
VIETKQVKRTIFLAVMCALLFGCQQSDPQDSNSTAQPSGVSNASPKAATGMGTSLPHVISVTVAPSQASASVANPGAASPAASVTASLNIYGVPGPMASIGVAYSFTPSVVISAGKVASYTISNLPKWATFSSKTGMLAGTPGGDDAGVSNNISISVSDEVSLATLKLFSITVADSATHNVFLSWSPPAAAVDGSLINLGGYRVYYGTDASSLTNVIEITDSSSVADEIDGLTSGTWYFGMTAFDVNHVESSLSDTLTINL